MTKSQYISKRRGCYKASLTRQGLLPGNQGDEYMAKYDAILGQIFPQIEALLAVPEIQKKVSQCLPLTLPKKRPSATISRPSSGNWTPSNPAEANRIAWGKTISVAEEIMIDRKLDAALRYEVLLVFSVKTLLLIGSKVDRTSYFRFRFLGL